MTANQLAYQRNLETERSNRQQEAIKYQSNEISKLANLIRSRELEETRRHNLEQEKMATWNWGVDVGNMAKNALLGKNNGILPSMGDLASLAKFIALFA